MGAPTTIASSHQHFTPGNIRPKHPSTSTATDHDATSSNGSNDAAKGLEATYTSLIQEYLQVMCLDNATFLAERMVASCQSTNAWYLLAVCHFRSQSPQRALTVLDNIKVKTPASAYLVAKCCYALHQYGRAEDAMLEAARADYREYKTNANNHSNPIRTHHADATAPLGAGGGNKPMGMDEWLMEATPCPIPNGAAGLYLLGCICRRSNRKRRAMDYFRMSLQLDPLLWTSYEALCEMGATDIDPTSVFGVRPAEIDKLQERVRQQKPQEEMPLQEKPVLSPHHFTSPTPASAVPAAGAAVTLAGRSMDLGTPLSTGSISPTAPIFQTAHKSMPGAAGQTMSLPSQLHFDTPNLTPIPIQQDASFVQHHHYPPSTQLAASDRSSMARVPTSVDFVDSRNPNTIRRAKHVAARLYYQPSPETPHHFSAPSPSSSTANFGIRYPPHYGTGTNFIGAHSGAPGASSARRYLRGKSALWFDPSISETPLRRGGGRPSDVSTARRPRALFLSENKAIKEKRNEINHNTNGVEDDDHFVVEEDENFDHRRLAQDREENGFVVEGLEDLEQPNVMTDDSINVLMGQSPSLADDEKPVLATSHGAYNQDVVVALEDEIMEKHGSVQQILELFCLLGASYWRLCQYRCREALQLFGAMPYAQRNTGWVLHQEGRAYFEMAEYKNAQRCLELMQRVEPHRMKGLELLSTVLWQLKKEVELAHLAQRAVGFDRLSPEAWCIVGNCFSLQKEHETALVFFGRSLQLDPSFTYTHTLSGYEYMANEDFEKAMACFRSGIRSDERHYNAWYGMGAIYHRQEKYDLAEYHFERAVQINPQSSVLRCNLGMSQYSNGKPVQALHTLSEAFRLDPHNPQARFQRATIYGTLNRPEDALAELEKVRDAAPREATVHFAIGKVLKRLGRPEQAMRCFLTALDLDPKDNQLIKSAMDKLDEPDIDDYEEATAF